jgi:DNA polymerase-3 subunit epsilon
VKLMITDSVIVLDFETTGLDPSYHRATEVAAHLIENGRTVDTFHSLIDPGQRLSDDVIRLTGITNEMLVGQPKAAKVFPALRDFIGDRVVFAHKASFDFSFYERELHRIGLTRRVEKFVCTIALARRLTPGLHSYSLGRVASHLGVQFSSRAHRATADAEVCAGVLRELCKLVAQFGIDPIDARLLKRLAAYTPIKDVGGFLERHAKTQERSRRRSMGVPTSHNQSTGSGKQLLNSRPQNARRWRIYPAGNLRDLANDTLYRRDQLAFVGGADPFLMITTEAGEIRVPFSEITGGSPSRILMTTGARVNGARGADRARTSNSVPENSETTNGGGAVGAYASSSAIRPKLPPGWVYFSPPAATLHTRADSVEKAPAAVREVVPWFREPDALLREVLTRRAEDASVHWVYLRSHRFLLEVATQRVYQVYGWSQPKGSSTRFEVKGGVVIEIQTSSVLNLPDLMQR